MNQYVALARTAVETYIKNGKIIKPPPDLPPEFLNSKSGIFVTLEIKGDLRGCIGTYLPTKKNMAEEIISNAIAAAMEDYRFRPISTEELAELSYTVYLLGEPEPVKDPKKELDPKKFGVIIKNVPISHPNGADVMFDGHLPFKTGLLLPDLEGVDTMEQQVTIACEKGGIDLKRDKIIIYRFAVEKHGED